MSAFQTYTLRSQSSFQSCIFKVMTDWKQEEGLEVWGSLSCAELTGPQSVCVYHPDVIADLHDWLSTAGNNKPFIDLVSVPRVCTTLMVLAFPLRF